MNIQIINKESHHKSSSLASCLECGVSPSVEVMTGQDAEVICGEFQTGNLTAEESEEKWNIVLDIEKISVHPNYNITLGVDNSQYVYADVATIHLNEDLSDEKISLLTPICLPQPHDSKHGVHAGWSSPPPLKFIKEELPFHEEFYEDFSKLWHYNMSLIECQDPTRYFYEDGDITGVNLTYPTNSFYPPGTICAREKNRQFCPTSGESGSPLMVEDNERRFSAVGINSFIKGCSAFSFGNFPTQSYLRQVSGNPSVYSRLSCFLPWIAEQYGMNYTATEEDERCEEGTGDINEVGGDQCRTTPTDVRDVIDKKEPFCLFPFYLDGIEYNQCTLTEIRDFTRPRFICPIRTIRGRGHNGRNFTTDDVDRKYCPTNAVSYSNWPNFVYTFNEEGEVNNTYNGEWELDSDNLQGCFGVGGSDGEDGPYYYARPVFATCKNTCPGVNFPVVSGGFALIAATGIVSNVVGGAGAAAGVGAAGLGTAGIAPILGGLGLVGAAGVGGMALMSMADCGGPFVCVAPSGQCCLVLITFRGFLCPASC